MSNGKIFVRKCPGCSKLHQTADQTGKTKCDTCLLPPVLVPTEPTPTPTETPTTEGHQAEELAPGASSDESEPIAAEDTTDTPTQE